MKPLVIWSTIIFVLMICSFIVSGLFFFNSGIFDYATGEFTEDRAMTLLVQLDDFQEFKFGTNGNIIESIIKDEGEQYCTNRSDCTWISTICGGCNQIPINKKFLNSYEEPIKNACKDSSRSCDMIIYDVDCDNNRCKLIDK